MRLLIAMLVAVGLVAALTFGVVQVFDLAEDQSQDPTLGAVPTTTGVEVVPAEGQAFVRGTVAAIHIEGAHIPPLVMPLEILTPERGSGSGATFENAIIDGEVSTIEWDAGRPLEIAGDGGSFVLDPVILDADTEAMTIILDGVHGVSPAAYQIGTPVAVGSAGIAEPVDSVDFEAVDASTVEFRGGATTIIVPIPMFITGPASLSMDGTFEVQTAGGTQAVTHLEFAPGPLEIQLTPTDGGYTIDATLQGDFAAS